MAGKEKYWDEVRCMRWHIHSFLKACCLGILSKWGKKEESLFVEWNRRKDFLWVLVSHFSNQFNVKFLCWIWISPPFAASRDTISLLILSVEGNDRDSEPFPSAMLFQVSTGTMRHRRNGNFESSRLLNSSISRSIDVSCNDSVSIRTLLINLGDVWLIDVSALLLWRFPSQTDQS